MVGTIVPVVNGQETSGSKFGLVLFYVLGSLTGGAVLGVLLISLGAGIRHAWFSYGQSKYLLIAVSAAFLIGGAREAGLLKFPLPQSVWQVPRTWILLGHNTGAFLYGSVLGFSLFNPVISAGFYAVVIWIVLVARPGAGLVLAIAYVMGRVLPVLAIWYISSNGAGDTTWCLRKLDPFQRTVSLLNAMLLVGLGSFMLTATWFR